MTTLLEVRNLKKHYPIRKGFFSKQVGAVKAVDGITLSVEQGETLAVVGESGCGKSTTGRAILRLIEPTEGEIIFGGTDVRSLNTEQLRRFRTDMQMVFQDPYASLDPRWTVQRILEEPLRTHGSAPAGELKSRVEQLMEVVGLSPIRPTVFPMNSPGPAAADRDCPGACAESEVHCLR